MKAYVTSIGEKTTDLCVWSLERNGFEVVLLKQWTTLADKLQQIYEMADDDFIRVDADVVPNRNLRPEIVSVNSRKDVWWVQYRTYDWFKQDLTNGGVQFIKKECLPHLRKNIKDALNKERPETYLYRIKEFTNPRRCITNAFVMGLHGYKNDMERVKATKTRRSQLDMFDFELAERLNQL